MQSKELEDTDAFRRFNRFYTSFLGALRNDYLRSGYSLAEVRTLYEIAPGDRAACDVMAVTGLDKGYLSRILSRLVREKLIEKRSKDDDGRVKLLSLTPKGEDLLDDLREKARREAKDALDALSQDNRRRLLDAMETIMRILPGAVPSDLSAASAPSDLSDLSGS